MSRRKWFLIAPFVLCFLALVIGAQARLFGSPATAPASPAAQSVTRTDALPTLTPRPSATLRPSLTPQPTTTPRPTPTPDMTVAAVFTESSRPTEPPAPTATDTAALILTPDLRPDAGLRGAMAGLDNVDVALDAGVGVVSYDGETWSEDALFTNFAYDFMQRAPAAFRAEPGLDLLFFKAFAPFTAATGGERRAQAVGFGITRAAYERIAWADIEPRQLAQYLDGAEGCSVSLHPAMTPAFAKWISGR